MSEGAGTEQRGPRIVLQATSAADMMTTELVSVRAGDTVQTAARLLLDHKISGLPVLDDGGLPVGVLSAIDIVSEEQRDQTAEPDTDYYMLGQLGLPDGEPFPDGFGLNLPGDTLVSELMTPIVMAVEPTTPALEVIQVMLSRGIHRLFVVDPEGALLGVISSFDVLSRLRSS